MAVGSAADDRTILAALHARVEDFIDVDGASAEAMRVAHRLLVGRTSAEPARHGHVLAVLSARPGVGTTTLVANLVTLTRHTSASDVMLLDLGQPLRDDALYPNVQANFHFVEAARNLRRFDQMSVQVALSRHPNGLAALPLPVSLADMCDIPSSEALGLFNRLRMFFDLQAIDLGGFDNIDFIAQTIKAADDVMLMTKQNVGIIVSTTESMQELRKCETGRDHLYLTISKFDARLLLDTAQIAERLKIPLVLTVPNRREALVIVSNQGVMLAEVYPTNTYAHVPARVAQTLGYTQQSAHASALSSWVSGVSAWLSGRFGRRSKRRSTDATELGIDTTEQNAT